MRARCELINGRSAVTDEEVSRFFAAVGVIPVVGGMVKQGSKVPSMYAKAEHALDAGKVVQGPGGVGSGLSHSSTLSAAVDEIDKAKLLINAGDIPPGMSRPFRSINNNFPPDAAVLDAMMGAAIESMKSCRNSDCSEIAEKLLVAANGKGKIIEVGPKNHGSLAVYENGKIEADFIYHQVYTDGRYVYDPRLSNNPVPLGDWEQHMKGMNP